MTTDIAAIIAASDHSTKAVRRAQDAVDECVNTAVETLLDAYGIDLDTVDDGDLATLTAKVRNLILL